ncbi:hypothetical protein BJF90_15535 [Pseudonocardia sp. CNS-004]|nr:hypothetical protein BJF90_15535 [Pseudonocardia sp. CNS-004]
MSRRSGTHAAVLLRPATNSALIFVARARGAAAALQPGWWRPTILPLLTSFNNVPLSLMLTSRRVETLPVAMLEYVQTSFTPMIAA